MTLRRIRVRYADVAATAALVVALSGTAYAATSLPKGSVGTPQLEAAAVTTAKLRSGAVTGPKIARDSVRLRELRGVDVSGRITFTIRAHSCGDIDLGVRGAAPGQAVLLSFTGSFPLGLAAGEGQVRSRKLVVVPLCNQTDADITGRDKGVRVVTFD